MNQEQFEMLKNEVEEWRMESEKAYKILANVRDILLPMVDSEGNECGDMVACTTSNPECVECLAEQIRKQYEWG